MFAEHGIPVVDADAIVHALYRGAAVAPIEQAFPGSTKDGMVDRAALSLLLARDESGFKRLESIVHPLVKAEQERLVDEARHNGAPIIVLDIPLLFENGSEGRVDKVAVVSCDADIQRQRVLARPGMTEAKFEMILARQMPDVEKRRRADFIIDTGKGLDHARSQVEAIIAALNEEARGHA
ncbi:dephospho-CoA kinase [Rhizobium alvei]